MIEQIRTLPPHLDPELISTAKQIFKAWVLSGCRTTRRQVKYTAVPLRDSSGKQKRDSKGQLAVEWIPFEKTESEYINGVNLKALELIFKEPVISETSLSLIISNILQSLSHDSDLSENERYRIMAWIEKFHVQATEDLLAAGLPVSEAGNELYRASKAREKSELTAQIKRELSGGRMTGEERKEIQAQVVERLNRIQEQMAAGDMEEWDKLVERLRGTPVFEQAIRDVIKEHPEFQKEARKLMSQPGG